MKRLTILKRLSGLTALAAALALATPAGASTPDYCPQIKGEPKVYAIGSSTMGTILGPMLKRILADEGVAMSRWGRASSGLARPDFHDWNKLAPGLMGKHRPDIVVISLGTNDFQPLWNKGRWIGLDDKRWEKIYAQRVDTLLRHAAGKDKRRLVVWTGPHAFAGARAEVRAPIVNRIMRERVEAFVAGGGRAVFVDSHAATLDSRGKPASEARLPGSGSNAVVAIRQSDNIHLTTEAVRWLMAEPILAAMRPCLPQTAAPVDVAAGEDIVEDDPDDVPPPAPDDAEVAAGGQADDEAEDETGDEAVEDAAPEEDAALDDAADDAVPSDEAAGG